MDKDTKDYGLHVRIDPALLKALQAEARADGRNVSGLVRWILENWLDERAARRAKAAARSKQ